MYEHKINVYGALSNYFMDYELNYFKMINTDI